MNQERQDTTALADFALRMVIKSKGGYRFQADAAKGLDLALDAMFADKKFEPRAQLEALVRLGLLFETKHRAAPIADTIYAVLAKDERALRALGIASGAKNRQLRARFARMVGESVSNRAPVFGSAAPAGSLKVSSFLDPTASPLKRRPAGKRPTSPASTKRRRGSWD
ncbi:MAG: hypothetical protein RMA76_00705 [Deltaproteobacteria bacterium]|jgi:hypothetical protein